MGVGVIFAIIDIIKKLKSKKNLLKGEFYEKIYFNTS